MSTLQLGLNQVLCTSTAPNHPDWHYQDKGWEDCCKPGASTTGGLTLTVDAPTVEMTERKLTTPFGEVSMSETVEPIALQSLAEVPREVASQFDYIDEGDESYDMRLFELNGSWYDAHEFQATEHNAGWGSGSETFSNDGWAGYQPDSAFSATVIRFDEDSDYVHVGLASW
ncbi:hypothetical protein [Leifsonia sp. Leaf264]|uniref:hypothetical protein n=1 Tax=Leifsonia sp. Leaf264 TaxID=1736314 RepID=UPI0006F7F668|nr:hypothetical protein [Leifsonia sp. Leaf264]KQO98819.1 hypothetical protein ASF30_12210 [Leifsonia sp. Leaf264]